MPSTATDRLSGLSTSVAIKPPCRVATTANITLSGEQTINGVAVVADDRVLVKDQTNSVDNGIWVCGTGTWARAKDFDGNRDVVQGTVVLVRPASAGTLFYEVQTANPIVIGTSSITFAEADPGVETLITRLASTASASDGANLVAYNPARAYTLGLGAFLNYTFGRTAGEIAAGVTPTNYAYYPGDPRRHGAVGDGATDDTTAVQAVMSTGEDVDFLHLDCRVTSSLTMRSNQTLYASNGGGISGAVADYVLKGLGTTGAAISSVTAPITVLTWTITMASPAGLAAGDPILLYDVVADVYEVNRVQIIISNTVYCSWPITQNFATAANIRLYKLTPLRNSHIRGLKISNSGASGGGVSLTYAQDCEITGANFDTLNYIGVTFQSSLVCKVDNSRFNRVGASGVGLRVTKACAITNNSFVETQADESITLYKSNSHAVVIGNRIVQYLNGGSAGTAGNSILIDQHNYYNTISHNTCDGSATYHIYLYNNSSYNTVANNTLNRANLGAIKVQLSSNGNTIDGNICTNVTDVSTKAIEVTSDCSGNVIGNGNIFAALTGVAILDSQAAPGASYASQLGVKTTSPYLTADVRGGSLGVTTTDFASGTTGTTVSLSTAAGTGNTYGRLNSTTTGDTVAGELVLQSAGGNVGVGVTTGTTAVLDINGNTVRLRGSRTPASAVASGNQGDVCWDGDYIYLCVATNTWRRSAHATW